MAEQSAFLKAFDEMQKQKLEQQGFNAPAQMESVVDTVGQAPAVQSPFSQQAAAAPNPMAAAVDPMAQPDVLAAAPAVQAPQGVLSPEDRTRIEGRLAQTNADIVASGETVPSLGAEVPKEGFMSRLVGGLGEQFTQPAPYTPQGGGAEAETAFGATPTQPTLFREGLSALSKLNETPLTRPDSPQVEMATPDSVANLSVNGTDTVTPEAITEAGQVSPVAVAPQEQLPSTIQNANGQNLAGFKPKYKGQSLSDYMAYRDNEGSATVQVQDPQGRFRRAAAPIEGESPAENLARTNDLLPGQAAFQQESADREARQAARPDFGEAQERAAGTVTDRERRAARGDGMSDADRRDIAKANQRGASAGEVARGMKVAELNNIDLKTGKPLESVSGKELAETGKIRAETAQILSEIGEKSTELNLTPAEESRDKTAGTALAKWDDSGRATVTSNITSLDSITKGLEDGQIKTRGFIDALPFGSDWARAIVNPDAQDAKNRVEGVIFQTLKETLGAQFTEKEGKRLVEASYNPMLGPEANAARLRDYSNGLKKAVAARESQMAYLKKNKTLQGYDGATPEGIMSQVGSGGGGSQIQGDVNYQSDIQSKADQILSPQ
jgi:hypothetical protein